MPRIKVISTIDEYLNFIDRFIAIKEIRRNNSKLYNNPTGRLTIYLWQSPLPCNITELHEILSHDIPLDITPEEEGLYHFIKSKLEGLFPDDEKIIGVLVDYSNAGGALYIFVRFELLNKARQKSVMKAFYSALGIPDKYNEALGYKAFRESGREFEIQQKEAFIFSLKERSEQYVQAMILAEQNIKEQSKKVSFLKANSLDLTRPYAEFKGLASHPKIKRLEVFPDCLEVETERLYYETSKGKVKDLGSFLITLSHGRSPKLRAATHPVRCLPPAIHPHVMTSGEMCWGSLGEAVARLTSECEFAPLIIIVLEYLENINEGDLIGRRVLNWPDKLTEEEEQILKEREGQYSIPPLGFRELPRPGDRVYSGSTIATVTSVSRADNPADSQITLSNSTIAYWDQLIYHSILPREDAVVETCSECDLSLDECEYCEQCDSHTCTSCSECGVHSPWCVNCDERSCCCSCTSCANCESFGCDGECQDGGEEEVQEEE